MPLPMFGAPLGFSIAREEAQKDALAGMNILHTMGQLDMMPAQKEGLLASAALHRAQAEKERAEAAANAGFAQDMQALQSGGMVSGGSGGMDLYASPIAFGPAPRETGMLAGGSPASSSALMFQAGQAALGRGMPDKARQLINTGSLMLEREGKIAEMAARAQNFQSLIAQRKNERIAELAGSARDQASLDRALMMATSEGLDVSAIPRDYAAAKPVLEQIYDASIKAKDRTALEIQGRDLESKDANRRSQAALRSVTAELRRAQIGLVNTRKERLNKGGITGTVGRPTAQDLEIAGGLIKKEFPKMGNLKDAATGVASEAQYLIKANPGLTRDQATYQAFNNAKGRGDFIPSGPEGAVEKLNNKLNPWASDKFNYVGGGRTPATAIPAPTVESERSFNKYYILPDGRVAQWKKEGNARGWAVVPGKVVGSAAISSNEIEDEDLE